MKEEPKRCGKGGTKNRGGRRRGKEVGKEEEMQRVFGGRTGEGKSKEGRKREMEGK